jgi:protein-S-isoprenylcysteine O-methyltransferase Ste14
MTWSRIARRIRVPLGFVFAAVYLWLARPTPASLIGGAAIAAIGVAMRAAASGYITKNAALTTTGPYAHTRNPLYLGSIVIAAGFAVAARSWWVVLGMVVLFAAIYLPVIRAEEVFLRSQFPEYADYARRVPRLLPRLRRAQAGGGTFSRERYLQHREYNALLGTALMIAALAAKLVWGGR